MGGHTVTVQRNVMVHSYAYATVDVILDKIKTGGTAKDQVLRVRELFQQEGKTISDAEKKKLPAIIFQGRFSHRSKDGIEKASGLAIIDLDHTGTGIKEQLKEIPYVYAAFVSSGGNGVKVLVKIPVVTSDEEYKAYFSLLSQDIAKRLSVGVDESGKDISRACFFSYDPEIYINEQSDEWVTRTEFDAKLSKIPHVKTDSRRTYKKMAIPLDYIKTSIIGERHSRILRASILVGGYIAAGLVDEGEAVKLLEMEARSIDPEDFQTNQQTIIDGIIKGKETPLFEKIEHEISAEDRYGKLYYTLNDVKQEMNDLYSIGTSKGYYVGWSGLNELYTLKPKTTTYLYGQPYCGKTQFWHEVLINCSKFHGMRHAIFSPETGGAAEVFIELLEIYVGRDYYNDRGNQMTLEEKQVGEKFIDKYFIVLDPGENLLTVDDFFIYIDLIEREYNTKIHTTTIDPWNELTHNYEASNNRQDIYLEWTLGKIRQNAKVHDRHNAIITHITGQDKIKDKDTGGWYYPAADFREVAGGQSWSRKGMNMINLWRPPEGFMVDGIPVPSNTSIVEVQKVKPKYIGKRGSCMMYFDWKKHRFYEERIGKKFYAASEGEVIEMEQKFTPEQPQSDIPF